MKVVFAVGIAVYLFALSAQAISMRHDLPDSSYIVASGDYPALVDLFGPGDCIGTLVHPKYLLSVAHCAEELKVGSHLTIAGKKVKIKKVILHPDWNDNSDDNDIALIKLTSPVTEVTPLPYYRFNDELSKMVTIVGRGDSATGLQGEPLAINDGQLRRATNLIEDVGQYFFGVYFYEPGEANVTELEGIGMAGDSGCPVFIEKDGQSYIAGLNSYGVTEDGQELGQYHTWDYQTRVSTYVNWLDKNIK